jgi:hypothetical protein
MQTRKYLVAAALATFLTLSGQSYAGNQLDYSSPKMSNSPVLTYTGTDSNSSTRAKSDDVVQYDRAERQQENTQYGSRFQQERCEVLKNNSKALQRAGCM